MEDQVSAPEQAPAPVCYRHPKTESHVRCVRCDRYMCGDCMRPASVGHQCVDCVKEGNKSIRQARTVFGGKVSVVPAVTYVLIAVNVIAYLGELTYPDLVDRFTNLGLGLIGADGQQYVYQDPASLVGADGGPFTPVGIATGEWYRLITSAFLHLQPTEGLFGILHILLNMYWLWTLGRVIEQVLGKPRFAALYLLSALGGSVLGYLIAPDEAALGASGAIFGLATAYYIFSRRLNHDPAGARRLIVSFLLWGVISATVTSWEGHLGGLLAGGGVALCLAHLPRKWHLPATAGVLAVLVVLVVLKTSRLTGTL
ncbi:rhomboid family intramembrane serine protease [Planotetraspora thailandica]|uniref:Rhomboid family intramembrane serine protease n=1 Tax=Planotetraspora thailandica TaxID=487172 RepID=A0A8J3XUN6_9ACTN|nr:rhomboid family intramembrane serine protease [Planotetraspora thailandica]GII55612.1 rhomboid family intramembrane serine protease [Planotetraspora thailandica]